MNHKKMPEYYGQVKGRKLPSDHSMERVVKNGIVCNVCGQRLKESEFYKKNNDKIQQPCKKCRLKKMKQQREERKGC